MPEASSEPTYDVFVSYSSADQDWVRKWLVPRLKAEGLAVCTDQESFDVGVPSLVNMENAGRSQPAHLAGVDQGLGWQSLDSVRSALDAD